MYSKEATVKSVIGMHARPAKYLVELVSKFRSKVTIHYQGKHIDTSSMLGLLGGGIKGGAVILITGEGEDEVNAVNAAVELIETVED